MYISNLASTVERVRLVHKFKIQKNMNGENDEAKELNEIVPTSVGVSLF